MSNDVIMDKRLVRSNNLIGWVFLVLGIIGAILSAIITTEKIELLKDSSHVLSCSINESFSCGSVMTSWQADTFGFPNMIIGLIGFGIISAIGAGIIAGAQYKPWLWFMVIIGLLLGTIFAHWLFYSAVYVIGSLCIYCMGVWAVMVFLFTKTLSFVFVNYAPQEKPFIMITNIFYKYWVVIGLVWYGIIMLLTYIQFN